MISKYTKTPVRVIYIMGYGRSGSTVLDAVLGSHRDIESVGELVNLPRNGWINNEYCACKQRINNCSFWEEVKKVWRQKTGIDDVQEYIDLEDALQRNRKIFQGFSKPNILSHEFKAYAQLTHSLYKSILDVSGKSIIVDSSKNPLRAFILSFIPGIDLYLIHLVRDGRGVAWSRKKSFIKNERQGVQRDLRAHPVWKTAIAWLYKNMKSTWVKRQFKKEKSIQIRYEDFVLQPENTLLKIGGLVGVCFNEVFNAIQNGESLNFGHTVAGNRLRMSGKFKLQLDEEWKEKLTKVEQLEFCIISGWLLKKYKYNLY